MTQGTFVLTTAELAHRWQLATGTVIGLWRDGSIPPPINPTSKRGYRWALALIEQFERGDWKPR